MRVIAGKFKGKPLFSPKGNNARPTTDRVKETLFNILYSMDCIDEAKVLDLFAGSGALGIEALSRGASQCVFVDIDKKSVALLKKNLENVGASKPKYRVLHADYKKAVMLLTDQRFDLIFIDPPFKAHNEKAIVDLILGSDILSEDGVIVIEHEVQNDLAGLKTDNLPIKIDTRVLGNTALTFLTY